MLVIALVFAWLCLGVPCDSQSISNCDEEAATNKTCDTWHARAVPAVRMDTSNEGIRLDIEFANQRDDLKVQAALHPVDTVAVVSPATNVSTISFGLRNVIKDIAALLSPKLWKLYAGQLHEPYMQSAITGHLFRGLFSGFLTTDNETYVLQPAVNRSLSLPIKYTAVVYQDACSSSADNRGISKQAASGLPTELMCMTPHLCHLRRRARRQAEVEDKSRATSFLCDLRIICDFRWYRYVALGNTTYGTEMVVSLLRQVDQMFRSLDLDDDGRPENVGFYLRHLDIYMDPVLPEYEDIEHWNAPRFFEEFGAYDFGDVCAGLLFTYRELSSDEGRHLTSMPTLPKTNILDSDQGICSQYVPPRGPSRQLADYGEYVANALPVNFLSRDHRVASLAAIVVQTAHQLGHLFGASDDAHTRDFRCMPDDTELRRNYIMAYPLVTADVERNFRWSPCSRVAIETFLRGLEAHDRPCLKPCRDPATCLQDSWNVFSGDHEYYFLGPHQRSADARDDGDKRDTRADTSQPPSTSTPSDGLGTGPVNLVRIEPATANATDSSLVNTTGSANAVTTIRSFSDNSTAVDVLPTNDTGGAVAKRPGGRATINDGDVITVAIATAVAIVASYTF